MCMKNYSEQKQKRRTFTPNVITAFGLCCGLFIIFKSMLKTSSSLELIHRIKGLSILIISAMIADVSDGAIARMMKAESAFGAQFDSLSDAITFGIAPPLIAIKSLDGVHSGKLCSAFILIASMIYALCGVLRLVRYNLSSQHETPDNTENTKHLFFIGLPIPAAAASVVSLALFLASNLTNYVGSTMQLIILSMGLIFIGGLMISPWKFPSVKNLTFKVSSFKLVAVVGILTSFFFLGMIEYFAEVFFFVSWSYILAIFPIYSIFAKKIRVE